MIKKILFIIIISSFLSECNGYKPIYGKQEQSFKLGKIETIGNKKLNKIILRNLKTYKKEDKKNIKILDLEIETKFEKKIKSKDKKGNPNKFEISILTNLIINKNKDDALQKSFYTSNIYNAFDSEFEQNKYEKTIEKTLISKISQKLIIYLQTL
tara:strand:+ start:534 stop:998 length:465 start_codon:yes stop_codon:yes gene_type:complete